MIIKYLDKVGLNKIKLKEVVIFEEVVEEIKKC